MKLYQFSWGIYPRRVHIYLQEKGITDLDMIDLDVVARENKTPEYLAMNPSGTIPVLAIGDGGFVRQSTSILLYLEETRSGPAMLGDTPARRAASMDQISLLNEAYNFAGICTYYGSPLFEKRRLPSDEVARANYQDFVRVMGYLEGVAGDAPYLYGDRPGLADVVFFASEQFTRTLYRLRIPARFTKLERIYQTFAGRPSAAAPDYPPFIVENAPLRPGICSE